MNKNAIKSFAVWARIELIDKVTQKAFEYGIEKDCIVDEVNHSINGRILSNEESNQRKQLIHKIQENGFDQVMEEVAYTWFNRFIALRFMEVNNYLPSKVRIFTNENNEFQPQVLQEALDLDFHGLDFNRIYELMESNNKEELFKYILVAQCNELGNILPGMFTQISDYKVLLLPNNLLREGSILNRLISDIDEEDWQNNSIEEESNGVEIVGWLYQYYISDRHNQVVNILKGTVKKEDIPAATQLFTTDWVVRYMVDNSLGRYWVERHPESNLRSKLKYFIAPKSGDITYVNENVEPKDLTFFDPCMGSGHILVYAFDVLMEIYREYGYSDRDAVREIIENNLYGLDIDDRCSQMAYFVLMMKARSYDRRFFTRDIQPNIYSIQETNYLNFEDSDNEVEKYLIECFKNVKELGSLIYVDKKDYEQYELYLHEKENKDDITFDYLEWKENILPLLKSLVKQAEILSKKYAVVCTNPPYLNKMEGNLKKYVNSNFKEYSGDLFSVFMYRNFDFCVKDGYSAFMSPFVWMFKKKYIKLREDIINNKSISSLIKMEYSAYEEATVPLCTFVLKNGKDLKKGLFFDLSEFKGGMGVQKSGLLKCIENKKVQEVSLNSFKLIPDYEIAFTISEKGIANFSVFNKVDDFFVTKQGLKTGNNELFLKLWFEVENNKFNKKWIPCNKGGSFRKWYGNKNYVINWDNNGFEIKNYYDTKGKLRSRPQNLSYNFNKGLTWSSISSGPISVRLSENMIYESKGSGCFSQNDESLFCLQSFINSKVGMYYLSGISPTLDYTEGILLCLPYKLLKKELTFFIERLAKDNYGLSKNDWDSFETSWDFEMDPLVRWSTSLWDATAIGCTMSEYYGHCPKVSCPLELCYLLWKGECESRFKQLQSNEEELNRIFIDIYGLQDELTPEVSDKDVTVYRIFDSKEDIPSSMGSSKYSLTKCDVVKSFISYAVGCMFGRYSLDCPGLAFAGGEWDDSKYRSFIPDVDNIIPICDDEYFEDDIVGRFIKFVEVVYSSDSLESNLDFIASALGGKGTSREVIRKYFLNDFYKDHCKIYQITGSGERPIYWLFDSGKKNGFKALVYLHRYQADTIARLRTGYVHEMQARYYQQIQIIEDQLNGELTTSDKVKLNKELKKFKEQSEELKGYEEKVHHYADQMIELDLDDGVKVNYEKFADILAKIK